MEQAISRTIHVIDDDDAVRDSLRVLLESHGLEVRAYASAEEFLTRLRKDPKGCMLLDQHMPGVSGIELLETIRKQGSLLPAVLITGRSDPSLRERAMRAGALALLDKPVEGDMLIAALDRALMMSPQSY